MIRSSHNIPAILIMLFVVILFLLPYTISLPQKNTAELSNNISTHLIEPTIVFAADPTDDIGGIRDTLDSIKRAVADNINPFNYFIGWIGNAILWITGRVTWLGGQLLEVSTSKLVLGMGEILNSSFGSAIDSIWKTVRDICNLAFIFGFIFTGIRTIIDPENAETKRFISKIIIAALLINFSLFFVKVIIDFSNFTAYQIYTEMTNGSGSLAQKVADTLGIVSFFSVKNPNLLNNITGTGAIGFYVMAGIFLIIAGFVFAAGAILLISRFVTLIYIMIASPVLFAGTIFPQTEEYASNLWHKLISAAFFAPAYFLFTIIAIRLLEALPLNNARTGDSFASALNAEGGAGFFDIVLFFFVAIFFLMGALSMAHSMGIKGGDIVIKKTKSMIGASTAGLAAKVGRATAGRIAHNISERDGLKDTASQKGIIGWGARRALQASRAVGDTTFDARKVAGLNTLGLGDTAKGGYTSVLKEVKKKEEEYAKSLGEVGDDDARVLQRKKEAEHAGRNVEKEKENLSKLRKERDIAQERLKKAQSETEKNAIIAEIEGAGGLDDQIEHQKHHIHETEENHEKAKVKYEQEKMRRQVGSTFTVPKGDFAQDYKKQIEENEKWIRDHEDATKRAWGKFMSEVSEMTDEEQEKRRAEIQKLMDKTEQAKKDHDLYLAKNLDRGYAGVLEGSSHIESWLTGRLVAQDREAGKAIRKARKKGKPKDSGDHGGGHDAHGGGHDAHAAGGGHDAHGGGHDAHAAGGGHGHGAH